ncbi:MAG: GNAT family N-acetyltransferase [Chloroflexi bacterium]|jgi:amino-acid N-acetyltransferase|nr:GNAT family N-acetyltransferase [Chloroflexota bacterium]
MSGPRADGAVPAIPPLLAATGADVADVEALVAAAGLTRAGLDTCVRDGTAVICRGPDGRLLGVAATERHGSSALLRSVAVHGPARGHGLGHALVERALADARAAGARDAWLLTETAEPFFAGLGWVRVERDAAPPAVAASVEFASACPIGAIAMRRSL